MMEYFASVTMFLRLVMMLKYLDTQHDSPEEHIWEAETELKQRHTHACEFAPRENATVSLQSCA